MKHTGQCLCGGVAFTMDGPLRGVAVCHCGQCRQWHGHVGAYTNVAEKHLTFQAQVPLTWFRSSSFAQRGFCRNCGSSLFWKRDGSPEISVAAGTLSSPTGLKTVLQIYTDHRGDYYDLDPDLPSRPGTDTGG